jgi:hypothetical protein
MTARYVIHNMFGPTVYQTDDRDRAYELLAQKWGTKGGWYRLFKDGREIARVNADTP